MDTLRGYATLGRCWSLLCGTGRWTGQPMRTCWPSAAQVSRLSRASLDVSGWKRRDGGGPPCDAEEGGQQASGRDQVHRPCQVPPREPSASFISAAHHDCLLSCRSFPSGCAHSANNACRLCMGRNNTRMNPRPPANMLSPKNRNDGELGSFSG